MALFFERLGLFVTKYWVPIILFWFTVSVCAFILPPKWDDVTLDGDLAYLPATVTSAIGEAALAEAFPQDLAKSQVVIVVTRSDQEDLSDEDLYFIDRLAAPFQNAQGIALFQQAVDADSHLSSEQLNAKADTAWLEANLLDGSNPAPLWNLSTLNTKLGRTDEADEFRQKAIAYDKSLKDFEGEILPEDQPDWKLFDVWTRHTPVVGEMLTSEDNKAVLVVLRITNEFMATENVRIIEEITQQVQQFKDQAVASEMAHLKFNITGNAAVGGDMLLAAKQSIANTEKLTVVLIIVILLLIYRSPVMLLIPMVSIGVSLVVSTWLVAALTQVNLIEGFEWWNFKVFKTSKIFIIVILFGAGTDFCLFLIARYREELIKNVKQNWAVPKAIAGVGDALVGSALTTIFGLGMMFFADFGKYSNSGPAIALCLFITLITCLTLSPALLRALGPLLFWPWKIESHTVNLPKRPKLFQNYWERLTGLICQYPGFILVGSVSIMAIPAVPSIYRSITTGEAVEVSYDMLNDLENDIPSKMGAKVLENHFPLGETTPITILIHHPDADFDSPAGETMISSLAKSLFDFDEHIVKVFSSETPLGKRPKRYTPFSSAGRAKLFLKNHIRTKEVFLSQVPELQGHVTRLRVVTDLNPFSIEAVQLSHKIKDYLVSKSVSLDDPSWKNAEFKFAGTTISIGDLRDVTTNDTQRIEILVVVAVFIVLLVILRKPVICLYMITSVLFSYYVTIGLTAWFFEWVYYDSYAGLDWKVPLFLFVILVAIGQDYNIYLATRVFEEQRKKGAIEGLKSAVGKTGGIITSCGLIMAGTFGSMCAGSLRGIIELGFALTLGVLIDTFIVRTILMPCFLALLIRWQERGETSSESNIQE